MADYDELWDEYAGEYNRKLEETFNGDWSKLDEFEQEIAALWKLSADVYMDGFDAFFLNWGYDCYCYAMRGIKHITDANHGLEKTKCENVYKLFETAYEKVFARFENDERIKSYNDIPQYFTEEDEDVLANTFDVFDEELGTPLCEGAYKFYFKELDKQI